MPEQTYNWTRFWYLRERSIVLTQERCLYDPESEWGKVRNSGAVAFGEIAEVPCLVLLGEPGIGKTCTMRAACEVVEPEAQQSGNKTLWLDLRSYGTEDRICNDLFESRKFLSWEQGDHVLHVFLDSLDECLLRIDNVLVMLIDKLKRCPVGRLRLRLLCRTAEWPDSLEDELRTLFGKDAVNVYKLAPLRVTDIAEAATAVGLNEADFLAAIDRSGVVSFAARPITLDFLLRTYSKSGELPTDRRELYLRGCGQLCEEYNASRRGSRQTGNLTAGQRIAVAARIAALTSFSNRNTVWTGHSYDDVPEGAILVQELCGGTEEADGARFEIDAAAIEETLQTALFSTGGPNCLSWSHRSYAEFLAARYLIQRNVGLLQVMSLIVHGADPEGRLVPQLHGTVAWLATMDRQVFERIVTVDPEVLLRSDAAMWDDDGREALVRALLQAYDEEVLLDSDWGLRKQYENLLHPKLAEQVRPYICDTSKGDVVRRVAIDIAEHCRLTELQDDLVRIALARQESRQARINAAYAISKIGDNQAREQLRSLVTDSDDDDPDDELKGCTLRALWPGLITLEDLFAAVTPPKQDDLFGSYTRFLRDELAPHIEPGGLPAALGWVEKQDPSRRLPYPFDHLINAIMLIAWESLDVPTVLDAFARTALSRLKHHDAIVGDYHDRTFAELLGENTEMRRRVLSKVFSILSDPEEVWILITSATPLATASDMPWLADQLHDVTGQHEQSVVAHLMRRVFIIDDSTHREIVLREVEKSPVLAEAFTLWITPVELDSAEAERSRKLYYDMLEQDSVSKTPRTLEPPPAERVLRLLESYEEGNVDAWWQLNREMTLEPDSMRYGNELESDLRELPGWQEANRETRLRIVRAAEDYVAKADPHTERWLCTNKVHRPAFAGYRALLLLQHQSPHSLQAIPDEAWQKWAPMIVAYPIITGTGDEAPHQSLVREAYEHAPEEVIDTLMLLIDDENEDSEYLHITRKIESCWDDRLGQALLAKAQDPDLKPEFLRSLLSDLMDHRVHGARAYAQSLITTPPPEATNLRARSVAAASALMNHTEHAGWSALWPVMEQHPNFGREVVESRAVSSGVAGHSFLSRLNEQQLADLYIWMVNQYPPSGDPEHDENWWWASPRDNAASLRDAMLRQLQDRGTPEACAAIEHIIETFPGFYDRLKWLRHRARELTRARTWTPPRPVDILNLASHPELRLIQGGDQLIEVIVESLERLQQKLHGETPAAIDLWNEMPGGKYKPKDEPRMSDYVKRHLQDDLKDRGVVVNREVEIRRREGQTSGQETDIHVDAVLLGPEGRVRDCISAIIEVKGCWNQELQTAMETQLVRRYLRDNRCQQGLYLVGWFMCEQWDDEDYRKGRTPKMTPAEMQTELNAQAAGLSTHHNVCVASFVLNAALRDIS